VLRIEVTPTDWNKSLMIFIPKSNNPYQCTLTGLRLITLLETIQKVFLKTIFSRITTMITDNTILKGADFSVFPDTSTYDSILPLTVFLEETHCTKRPGYLFLEDKSAAFDSVTYNLIFRALSRIRTPTTVINLYTNMLHSRQTQVLTAYGPSTPFYPQKAVPQGGIELPLIWLIYC
jgi:Reverse transcriptase (RNA-dependent DNA polymerase)